MSCINAYFYLSCFLQYYFKMWHLILILFRDLKSDQKEALENFQNRLSKAEHSVFNEELGFVAEKQDPSTQYEVLRRRIRTNVKEFWYFISAEVANIKKQSGDLPPETLKSLAHILNLGVQHKRYNGGAVVIWKCKIVFGLQVTIARYR